MFAAILATEGCNGLKGSLKCAGSAVKDKAGDLAGGAAGKASSAAMDGITGWFQGAAADATKTLTSLWLKIDSPDVDDPSSSAMWLQERLNYFVLVAMVASFLVAAWKIATQPQVQHARDLSDSIVRVLIVTTVGGLLITTSVQIGDIFAQWILEQADVKLSGMVMLTGITMAPLVLILSIIVLLAQLVQVLLMIVRNAMIIYLAAVLPIAAASSTTAAGKQWWAKSVGWLVAFILYKPVAALIYAGALKMMDTSSNLGEQITGVAAMVMAIFALPALMRFVVPATSQMAAGNSGAMALGMTGAAVATGAVALSGGGAAAFSGGGFSGGMPAGSGSGPGGAVGASSAGPESRGSSSPPPPPPSGSGSGGDGPTRSSSTEETASTGGSTGAKDVLGAAQTGHSVSQGVDRTASGAVEAEEDK